MSEGEDANGHGREIVGPRTTESVQVALPPKQAGMLQGDHFSGQFRDEGEDVNDHGIEIVSPCTTETTQDIVMIGQAGMFQGQGSQATRHAIHEQHNNDQFSRQYSRQGTTAPHQSMYNLRPPTPLPLLGYGYNSMPRQTAHADKDQHYVPYYSGGPTPMTPHPMLHPPHAARSVAPTFNYGINSHYNRLKTPYTNKEAGSVPPVSNFKTPYEDNVASSVPQATAVEEPMIQVTLPRKVHSPTVDKVNGGPSEDKEVSHNHPSEWKNPAPFSTYVS